MYEIFKEINEMTFLATKDKSVFLLKKTGFEDVALYNRLKEIRHRNVASVFEVTTIDGCVYAVCEYVSGLSLSEYIENNGCLSDEEVKSIISSVCDGLSAIHEKGIIHRDINPSNIMITESGDIKIVDFGISRFLKAGASSDTQILGTHGYAAPEQFGFRQSSPRTDIYAIGVLLNYLKTGCLPQKKLAGGVFEPVVLKCIEIDEKKRYQSASELKQAIAGKKAVKKNKFSAIFYKIPGFREDNNVITAFSVCYYLFCLFMFTAVERTGVEAFFGDYLAMVFLFWVPYFLIWDIGHFSERLGFSKRENKTANLIVRIAGAILSLFISFVLISSFPEK